MEKVRLGIIGFGNMGTNHFKNIMNGKCPEIVVTAVADLKPSRLELIEKLYNDNGGAEKGYPMPKAFSTAEELITSGEVDAILVAVPHYDHPKFTIMGFQNGLHVMCEKPAGVYTLQVREMIAEADKHPELVFGMMFNQRTNETFCKMKEIVDSGVLGKIKRTNWIITTWYRPQSYYDSGDWRATWKGEGGGVLLNQCPHNLDLWQWICGMPVKVDAKLHYGKWHNIEVEDDVTAYVEYANGATGVFVTTTGDYPGTNRFEITFEGGKLVCEEKKELIMYKLDMFEPEFSKQYKGGFGHPNCEKTIVEVEKKGVTESGHPGVLNAFAGAILRGESLIADGREGINGLTISNAMHLSSWLGKPVELPFDEELYKAELFKRVDASEDKKEVADVSAVTDMDSTF